MAASVIGVGMLGVELGRFVPELAEPDRWAKEYDVLADIEKMRDNMLAQTGVGPNTLIMSPKTWRAISADAGFDELSDSAGAVDGLCVQVSQWAPDELPDEDGNMQPFVMVSTGIMKSGDIMGAVQP